LFTLDNKNLASFRFAAMGFVDTILRGLVEAKTSASWRPNIRPVLV